LHVSLLRAGQAMDRFAPSNAGLAAACVVDRDAATVGVTGLRRNLGHFRRLCAGWPHGHWSPLHYPPY
jgi:hypothetical protein